MVGLCLCCRHPSIEQVEYSRDATLLCIVLELTRVSKIRAGSDLRHDVRYIYRKKIHSKLVYICGLASITTWNWSGRKYRYWNVRTLRTGPGLYPNPSPYFLLDHFVLITCLRSRYWSGSRRYPVHTLRVL